MTVEMLHFKNGYRLNPDFDFSEQVAGIASTYESSFSALEEGEHDLVSDGEHKHQLIVLENGTGVYRIIPLSFKEDYRRAGGKPIGISQPNQVVFVSVYSQETGQHRVYDVIRYMPGRSPK